jgi:hypothetical protein
MGMGDGEGEYEEDEKTYHSIVPAHAVPKAHSRAPSYQSAMARRSVWMGSCLRSAARHGRWTSGRART